ncbi:tetratricopeptide repeat protein [Flavobacterium pallidum]|uniref:Histidine kinase domain-containing protein n=1 Tax=Flavobacterium pallidum TaxID=2172098 RepID=A0A2S1SIP2_9FLAO|nr:tetratricopeptide repeat protein [Flavobacterium pallidum]AWI26207.1 hypothetical protein HYN49_10010 [Flavobacterium pallidum]
MVPHILSFRKILPGLFVLLAINVFSQTKKIDSLNAALVKYDADKMAHGNKLSLKDSVKIRIYENLSIEYYMISDAKNGMDYSTKGVRLSEKLDYKTGLLNGNLMLGVYYSILHNFDKSMWHFKKALAVARQTHNLEMEQGLYNNIGSAYSEHGNYEEGLAYFYKGLGIAKKRKDKGVSTFYNNIGIIYGIQGRYKEEISNYMQSLKYQEKLKSWYGIGLTAQNIAESYYKRNLMDEAEKWYTRGVTYAQKGGNKISEANNHEGLGKVSLFRKDFSGAVTQLEMSLSMRKITGDSAGISSSLVNLGGVYLKKGNFQKALSNLNEGLSIARKVGNLDAQKLGYSYLAETYGAMGKYKQAYESHVQFKTLSDSIFNAERDKKLTELRLTNEFNTKQKEQKALQQKKDAATALKARQQRSAIYAVLIALIIVTFFAFWINYNLQRNKKQKRIIEEQNEKIGHSLDEKETLLREIHHRVKNNLQIISSLLNIQSENIKDETLLSSIQEGQSRVQAMSLIHQNLYQSEHLNTVDIENYLRELVVYLSQMFRADSKNIETKINTDGIQFDIDTAIPLGLIVNELVSNAYKYAFENRENGKISIRIHASGDAYELHIENDGKPLPADFDMKTTKSLGLRLVSILSRQLRGKLSFHSDERNTSFVVSFKDLKSLATD